MKIREFVKESLLHFDAKAQIKPFTERYLIKKTSNQQNKLIYSVYTCAINKIYRVLC